MEHVGQISALASAAFWVVTGLAFAVAGRKVGAWVVNAVRIWFALGCLLILHVLLNGSAPPAYSADAWLWLSLSGVLGLAIGDQFLYQSLVDAGPRTATLVMATVPGITAAIAWPVLGQAIGAWGLVGMSVTLAGIITVIAQQPRTSGRVYPMMRRGVMLAFIAAICQAVGLVTAKLGMGNPDSIESVGPWAATLIRVAVATPVVTVMLLLSKCIMRESGRMMAENEAGTGLTFAQQGTGIWWTIILGAVCGPFLGVGTALVAIDYIDAGVAATLMATSPVMIIPFARWIEGEHFNPRALWGAVIAVIGVGLLTMM